MDSLIIENVRCFLGRQEAPLRPITLLVGENSTGKTTFLALARMAWDICMDNLMDFNEEPFQLGAYENIASHRGGRRGRAKCFRIGANIKLAPSTERVPSVVPRCVGVTSSFIVKEGQPRLREWLLDAGPYGVRVDYGEGEETPVIIARVPLGTAVLKKTGSLSYRRFGILDSLMRWWLIVGLRESELGIPRADAEILVSLAQDCADAQGDRPYAFAPIRTRPKRTYDPVKDIPEPEGSHVPMVLANTFSSDTKAWQRLRHSLDAFGKSSGLFSDLEVQRLGKGGSGPFQIRIKVAGAAFNLIEVGYGISQVLPIVVDCLEGAPGSTFLLQQPEVHLHPRAQAELGSFLGTLAKAGKKRFLIETHSDYLVDRIRMDIRDKKGLTPDDVALLYFERADGGVRIHTLEIDEYGNLVNPPAGYRKFFLDEERRLLGG